MKKIILYLKYILKSKWSKLSPLIMYKYQKSIEKLYLYRFGERTSL